jgi:hypothetical protein
MTGAMGNLVTWEDTQKMAVQNPSAKMWQQMQFKVTNNLMPPPYGSPAPAPLTSAERATLDAWFAAGAPGPGTAVCP